MCGRGLDGPQLMRKSLGGAAPASMRTRPPWASLVLALAGIACGPRPPQNTVAPTPQAAACIAPTEARFTFPPEPAAEVTWNAPGPAREEGRPEYLWQVYWILNWGHYGKRPHAIWAVKRWASTGEQHGTVRDLLSQTPVLVMTSDTTPGIDLPISQGVENPAVVSTVEHRQVALVVRGRDAIQQIFPTLPDSVHLLRRRGSGAREEEVVIPVAHANRSCRPPA